MGLPFFLLVSIGNPYFTEKTLCLLRRCTCATKKYRRDEGRPLEVGLQELASNHLKLLW